MSGEHYIIRRQCRRLVDKLLTFYNTNKYMSLSLADIALDNRTLTFEIGGGTVVVEGLSRIASIVHDMELHNVGIKYNANVSVNGVTLNITSAMTAETVRVLFDEAMQSAHEAYISSSAYAEFQQAQKIQDEEAQGKINDLMAVLATVDSTKIKDWLIAFIPCNGRRDINFSKELIHRHLERLGYKENAHVGVEPESFTEEMTLQWVIGQAMASLSMGLSIHPVLLRFLTGEAAPFKPQLGEYRGS